MGQGVSERKRAMELVRGIDERFSWHGGFVSIGNFDGVHLGHACIVDRLVSSARSAGVSSVVLTFDPHPGQLLRPELAPALLSTIEERAELLGELGVDVLVAMPTTLELLSLEASEFFGRVVVELLGACGLVEGPNFCFGRDRTGDVEVLGRLCGGEGMSLELVEPGTSGGELVSSSRIRASLDSGEVVAASGMLGRPYRVRGVVVSGEGRGRELGVPTANLGRIGTLVPSDGVYVGSADVSGRRYPAAVHVGGNPTFGESDRKVEVHLLAFDGDLYGQELSVEFLERVRETREFGSVDELKDQLAEDIEAVWVYLESDSVEGVGTGESGGDELS